MFLYLQLKTTAIILSLCYHHSAACVAFQCYTNWSRDVSSEAMEHKNVCTCLFSV